MIANTTGVQTSTKDQATTSVLTSVACQITEVVSNSDDCPISLTLDFAQNLSDYGAIKAPVFQTVCLKGSMLKYVSDTNQQLSFSYQPVPTNMGYSVSLTLTKSSNGGIQNISYYSDDVGSYNCPLSN
jgi:hypothetical protein